MLARPETAHSALAGLSAHGNVGVDFFFVLSGFIILFAHQQDIGKPEQLARYLKNRFVRLYPIYWLYSAILVVLVLTIGGITAMPRTALDWLSTWTLLRFTSGPTALSVAWTLFYEIAFYLIFAALIVSRRVGILLFSAWAVAIFAFHRYTPTNSVIGVWTSLICLNFFVGMCACWLHTRTPRSLAVGMISVGLLGLIAAGAYVDHGLPSTAFEALIALSCGSLICGAAAIETRAIVSFGALALLGDASYTIYLAHEHLTPALLKVLVRLHILGRVPADVTFLVVMFVVVAVCVAAYFALERPVTKLFRTPRRRRPTSEESTEFARGL